MEETPKVAAIESIKGIFFIKKCINTCSHNW